MSPRSFIVSKNEFCSIINERKIKKIPIIIDNSECGNFEDVRNMIIDDIVEDIVEDIECDNFECNNFDCDNFDCDNFDCMSVESEYENIEIESDNESDNFDCMSVESEYESETEYSKEDNYPMLNLYCQCSTCKLRARKHNPPIEYALQCRCSDRCNYYAENHCMENETLYDYTDRIKNNNSFQRWFPKQVEKERLNAIAIKKEMMENKEEQTKRVGRPRKNPIKEETTEPKRVGRPRKNPIKEETTEPKRVGRPSKKTETMSLNDMYTEKAMELRKYQDELKYMTKKVDTKNAIASSKNIGNSELHKVNKEIDIINIKREKLISKIASLKPNVQKLKKQMEENDN